MQVNKEIFNRMELLVGCKSMSAVSSARVIVFGVGGVGSWCAESLIRSGIRRLAIVDSDRVSITNVNRQLMATTKTVGMVKVEALKNRLLEINPDAEIDAVQGIYDESTAEQYHIEDYDYIVDAIDSLKNKALLILNACKTNAALFSSMGAALKMDSTRISVAEFWKVKGCPLAAALRRKFRHNHTMPAKKFKCVFSDELLHNLGKQEQTAVHDETGSNVVQNIANQDPTNHCWDNQKAQINGSIVHITAIFGFTLAGLIISDIHNRANAR